MFCLLMDLPHAPPLPLPPLQFPWRNGWFYDISKRAVAAGKADPLPLHTSLLKDVGAA